MSEISKFFNFWAISTCNTSKESIFHIEFNFKQKNYDLFEEKVKKSNFFDFFFKIDADHLSSNVIFSNLCQKILKLSLPVLWKRFEIKSHQRRACYLKPRRNGGPIPTGGGSRSPPTLTRVNGHFRAQAVMPTVHIMISTHMCIVQCYRLIIWIQNISLRLLFDSWLQLFCQNFSFD